MRSVEWLVANDPQNRPNFCIFVAFNIFVVGERRNLIFSTQADHS